MSVITIYEGIPGADEVARKVARSLDYACVGRDELVATLERYGIPRARLDEITEKEPHWWEQWFLDLRPYRIALQAAMCELAQAGPMVYHGHVGHELLPGVTHVLKVLLTGSTELRVTQLRSRLGVDEETARKRLEHTDRARSRRLMALFGHDWQDASRYDLVLNLAMGPEAASQAVSATARLAAFTDTPASRRAFQYLALTNTVRATLLRSEKFRNLPIDVRTQAGEITVSGWVPETISEDEIIAAVEAVPGVSKVTTDILVMPRSPGGME